MSYGHFDDARHAFVVTDPLPPRPWINYLTNRRLSAFISQNAGGLLWHLEPQTRRITRYHFTPAPGDRPGFYVYLRDRRTGAVWNPHFAPTCTPLDAFSCTHAPGITAFSAEKDGIAASVRYGIPPADEVMLWEVSVTNRGAVPAELDCVSYLEFGLLEFMREAIGWCYLRSHIGFRYDAARRCIRYDYHVFEAPATPRMVFGCTAPVAGWECAREAFTGRTGTLENPGCLRPGARLSNSDIPGGGHGCGTLGVDLRLGPGETRTFAYVFALADDWAGTDALLERYAAPGAVAAGFAAIAQFWAAPLGVLRAATGDAAVDRMINDWTPYNSLITCQLARVISTDHMGTDGLRFRDTLQDALAVAHLDPEFARERVRLVLAQGTRDGGGCMSFYPHTKLPTTDAPHRADNPVWPVYTIKALLAETGDWALLDEPVPYRDGGAAPVYEHVLNGLRHIHARRGPHGLPLLFDVDWNDSLAMWADPKAESVMLGMQFVYSCHECAEIATRRGRPADAAWCRTVAVEMAAALNGADVWDGAWYRRLLLSNGQPVGSARRRQGQIYLEPQPWAVISGVGETDGRGRRAMDSVAERLDTPCGIRILAPSYRGFPEPEDPPLGGNAGTGENGGIFCHANTWAIIAECLLGNAERAFRYYRQILPEVVSAKAGAAHYGREPYVFVSAIVGSDSPAFGQGGISWLTGTASWMHIAATQYLLGLRPTLDGLLVRPCLPPTFGRVTVIRRFRGTEYRIAIDNRGRGSVAVAADGKPVADGLLRPGGAKCVDVRVEC